MQLSSTITCSFPPHLLSALKTNPQAPTKGPVIKKARYIIPVIDDACFAQSLKNFHIYRGQYNKTIKALNTATLCYNKKVQKSLLKQETPAYKKPLLTLFTTKYSELSPEQYNIKVEEFNNVHGLCFKKRTLLTLKSNSIQYFTAILFEYKMQLQRYAKIWKQTHKQHPTPLLRVEINPAQIISQKKEDELILDVCKASVRRHRDRFQNAGVLINKKFSGSEQPCSYHINPAILVVNEYSQTIENQSTNLLKLTNCKDNDKYSTRTSKNNIEIKEIVNNLNKSNAPTSLLSKTVFYKSTLSQGEEPQNSNPPIAENKTAKNTQANQGAQKNENTTAFQTIANNTLSKNELAERLSNGDYNYYTPINKNLLKAVLYDYAIDNEDFKEVAIQDFLKSSAQLWRTQQGSEASWKIAIDFVTNDGTHTNFTGKAKSKPDVYAWLIQQRFRLNYACNWFTKKDWKGVWYPNRYFDPLRKNPDDVCFAYTKKVWNKKMDDLQKTDTKKRKRLAEAKKRDTNLANNRKLDRAIRKYFNNTYTMDQLTVYVSKLPISQQNNLDKRMSELIKKRLK